MAGWVGWDTREVGETKNAEISVARATRAAEVEDGDGRLGGSPAQVPVPADGNDQGEEQRIQQLLDRYDNNVERTDFETRQQAQEVFELDQILFGDALDSDINGTACDEDDFFSRQNGSKQSLLEAGGPADGPILPIPNCSCLKEYLLHKGGVCYSTSSR